MATRKILKKSNALKTRVSSSKNEQLSTSMPRTRKFPTKVLYVVVALLALSALILANKSLLVAAIIDGKPIFSWALHRVLVDRYGKQTLEGMISEGLIAGEAKRQKVVISAADVSAREAEIVKGLGGNMSLEEILKIQGLTKGEFDRQITLQLTVQKILGSDIVITDADVDGYIATSRATLVATEEAALRAEARQTILDGKIGEKLQDWFAQLKTKAKILRFL